LSENNGIALKSSLLPKQSETYDTIRRAIDGAS
jgi:hypothetical protein